MYSVHTHILVLLYSTLFIYMYIHVYVLLTSLGSDDCRKGEFVLHWEVITNYLTHLVPSAWPMWRFLSFLLFLKELLSKGILFYAWAWQFCTWISVLHSALYFFFINRLYKTQDLLYLSTKDVLNLRSEARLQERQWMVQKDKLLRELDSVKEQLNIDQPEQKKKVVLNVSNNAGDSTHRHKQELKVSSR